MREFAECRDAKVNRVSDEIHANRGEVTRAGGRLRESSRYRSDVTACVEAAVQIRRPISTSRSRGQTSSVAGERIPDRACIVSTVSVDVISCKTDLLCSDRHDIGRSACLVDGVSNFYQFDS